VLISASLLANEGPEFLEILINRQSGTNCAAFWKKDIAVRLVQYKSKTGERRVGVVTADGAKVQALAGTHSVYELATSAIGHGHSLAEEAKKHTLGSAEDYDAILADHRVLPPLDHPDPRVSGSRELV
jgi:hypothetical protein